MGILDSRKNHLSLKHFGITILSINNQAICGDESTNFVVVSLELVPLHEIRCEGREDNGETVHGMVAKIYFTTFGMVLS